MYIIGLYLAHLSDLKHLFRPQAIPFTKVEHADSVIFNIICFQCIPRTFCYNLLTVCTDYFLLQFDFSVYQVFFITICFHCLPNTLIKHLTSVYTEYFSSQFVLLFITICVTFHHNLSSVYTKPTYERQWQKDRVFHPSQMANYTMDIGYESEYDYLSQHGINSLENTNRVIYENWSKV